MPSKYTLSENCTAAIRLIETLDTLSDLREIYNTYRRMKDFANQKFMLTQLRLGYMIGFKGKRGEAISGELIKINPKRLRIKVEGNYGPVYWTIYPQHIESINGEPVNAD